MKKVFALVLSLAMVMALLAGCGGSSGGSSSAGGGSSSSSGTSDSGSGSSGNKTLKVGVFQPSTGDNGAGGKQEILGIEYANYMVPTVEINGETYDLVLEYADNQSSTDRAVSAAQSLVNAGVTVVLGSYGSGVSIAAAPTFNAAELPAIGCGCTNPAVTENNPYYFRVCFLDPFQGSVMANFAMENFSAKKAYILTMLGEDYGSGLGTYFAQAFEAAGGETVSESFPEGTSDFAAYIQNAINSGADVIFAPSATTYAALIISQAESMGLALPILAGDTWESPVILEAQQGTSQKVYCSTFFDENDDGAEAAAFVKGFKEWMNADSQRLTNNGGTDIVAAVSALGYDAYMTAIEGIKLAQSTEGPAIREALFKVDFPAVTGRITINELGDANKEAAYVKEATDGAFQFVKVQYVNE